MSARVFFDTTVLIYAFAQDNRRTAIAEELLEVGGAISVHVLNEFVAVARRKLGMSWEELMEAVTAIRVLCLPPVAITVEIHDEALRIAQRYGYHIYDSLVLAAAVQAGCNVLYSEDMQDGQKIGSVTIKNPFRLV